MSKIDEIRSVLGDPFYENEYGLIYNMDCKEGLLRLKGRVDIDLTITSPPYNIGKAYEQIMPIDDFISWLSDISNEVYEVTKHNGAYLLNLGYLSYEDKGRAVPIVYLIWDKTRFYLQQEIVWNYGAGVAAKNYLSPRNEKILWYVKDRESYTFNLDDIRDPDVKYPNQKKNGKIRVNSLGKNPSDVWQVAKVTSGKDRSSKERTDHPAQFPEDLVERMVKGFSKEGEIILDPFIGSGTTAKVAQKYNRLFLGFEIDTSYCETIKDRLISFNKELDIIKMTPKLDL